MLVRVKMKLSDHEKQLAEKTKCIMREGLSQRTGIFYFTPGWMGVPNASTFLLNEPRQLQLMMKNLLLEGYWKYIVSCSLRTDDEGPPVSPFWPIASCTSADRSTGSVPQ